MVFAEEVGLRCANPTYIRLAAAGLYRRPRVSLFAASCPLSLALPHGGGRVWHSSASVRAAWGGRSRRGWERGGGGMVFAEEVGLRYANPTYINPTYIWTGRRRFPPHPSLLPPGERGTSLWQFYRWQLGLHTLTLSARCPYAATAAFSIPTIRERGLHRG